MHLTWVPKGKNPLRTIRFIHGDVSQKCQVKQSMNKRGRKKNLSFLWGSSIHGYCHSGLHSHCKICNDFQGEWLLSLFLPVKKAQKHLGFCMVHRGMQAWHSINACGYQDQDLLSDYESYGWRSIITGQMMLC